MVIKIYTLNAFTKNTLGGNPAGVVLEADFLSDSQMQKIAEKIGFSETAFVSKSDKADFKVRFFTPNSEVDLCGHATIATFSLMSKLKLIRAAGYTQETKAGILNIVVNLDGAIFMNQPIPQFFEKITDKEIAVSLNSSMKIINSKLPIQIVSTSSKNIIVPIKNIKELFSIKPNFDQIIKICKKYNVGGYHLFTLETKFDSTAHCRSFVPRYGIPEDPAHGTANGALSCYLFQHKIVNASQANQLKYEQGYSMNTPSEILVSLKTVEGKILEVKVGGTASNIQQKELAI